MKTPLLFTAFLAFTISLPSSFAQEVIPATGGNATGSEYSLTYSIGHVFYSVYIAEEGSVDEGVQQPYEIKSLLH